MTAPPTDKPLHLHIAGWSGTSQSIALVNQWQALALSRRPDVRLSKENIACRFADDEVFSPAERARLTALPAIADNGEIDAELRTPFFASSQTAKHPVLAFAVSELRGESMRRMMPSAADVKNIERLHYTVPSRWVRDGMIEIGVPEEQVTVLPHGVDNRIFRPSQASRQPVRSELGLDRFTFLHIGAMVKVKGVDLLLKAFAVLLQRGLRVQLLLKGQDSVYESREWLAGATALLTEDERQIVSDHCTYFGDSLGMQPMAALYNACDAYVAPYRAEGFCLPVLEAAACGLPIIATGGGATDDFTTDDFRWPIRAKLQHTELGEQLEPDLDHLIDLMSRMVTARDFNNRASKAGPRHVAANYTWDHVAARIVQIVRGLK